MANLAAFEDFLGKLPDKAVIELANDDVAVLEAVRNYFNRESALTEEPRVLTDEETVALALHVMAAVMVAPPTAHALSVMIAGYVNFQETHPLY